MASQAEHPQNLSPRPRAGDPASRPTLTHPIVAELQQQWRSAARLDVWALLTALDRAGVACRLRDDAGWTFAAADLGAAPGDDGHALTIPTTFFGVLGPTTPLPEFASEAIEGAPQLLRLFEALQHRLLTHLHRALRRCHYPSGCTPERDDATSRGLIDLAARGVAGPQLPPRAWLRLLPWAPSRLRTAAGIATALTRLFGPDLGGAAISLIECVPHVGDLPDSGRTRLGRASAALSQRFALGDRAPDGDGWFRVRVATLSCTRARPFLRGGEALRRLFTAVAALAGPLLRFDVELALAPGAAPRMRLGSPQTARLAVDSWLIHLHCGPITVRYDDPG